MGVGVGVTNEGASVGLGVGVPTFPVSWIMGFPSFSCDASL